MTLDDDESLERELFALRAPVLPRPRLDWDDVMARASRPHRRRERAPWVYAVACAAASFVGLASIHDAKMHDDGALECGATTSAFDGLSCREGVAETSIASEPAMCVAPSRLVCE